MKKSNKIKLLAATATIVVTAAPLISMASCGHAKGSDITIDEKTKQKELESGKREATFEFKLGAALAEGEKIEAGLSDIQTSQQGYTVDVRNVIFEQGKDTTKVVVGITSTQNEILKEGATFNFAVSLTRLDKDSKTVWNSKIAGFKMTYAAPVKTGLTITDAAKDSYTNPAEMVHAYVFNVGSAISVDEECTYECDITKQSSDKQGLSVKFNDAAPISSNKQLRANFQLVYSGSDLKTDDMVTFDFTISCMKNGQELWRQSFADFKLSYLQHQMWILPEYQWESTYAGETEFHLYVIKNKNLHWGDAYQVGVDFAEVTAGYELEIKGTPTEPTTEQGTSYFDITVGLKSGTITADTLISFKPVLKWTQPGQSPETRECNQQTVTFYTKKIGSVDNKIGLEVQQKTHTYEFTMEAGQDLPTSVSFEDFKQIEASSDTSIAIEEIKVDNSKISVKTNINTNLIDAFGKFKFVIIGTTAEGKSWYQKIGYKDGENLELDFVDPVTVPKSTVQTPLDELTTLIPYNVTAGEQTEAAVSISGLTFDGKSCSSDIPTFDDPKQVSGENKISVVLPTPAEGNYNYNTWASFNTNFSYTVKKGSITKTGTKKILGLKVQYNGSVVYDETYHKQTNPGEKSQIFKFKNLSGLTNITASVHTHSAYMGYSVAAGTPTVTKDSIELPVIMSNTATEYMDEKGYCYFSVTFNAFNGSELLWSKTLGDVSHSADEQFKLTYQPGFSCDKDKFETSVSRQTGFMEISSPTALKSGESISMSIINQSSPTDIKVALGTNTVSGLNIKQNFTLTKEAGSLWTDGEYANFDLQIKRLNARGETVCCERITGCKVSYIEAYIKWNDGWYSYELDPSWPIPRSKPVKVEFELARPLADDEEIHFELDSVAKYDSKFVPMWNGQSILKTDGKTAWFECFTQLGSGFTLGDYCCYDLAFKCYKKDTTQLLWQKSIKDWYMYVLAGFIIRQEQVTTTGTSADFVFDLTAKITSDQWQKTVVFTETIERKGGTAGLSVVSNGKALDSEGKIVTQSIGFSGSTIPSPSDYVDFDLNYHVVVTYGTETYETDFKFENLRLTKQ